MINTSLNSGPHPHSMRKATSAWLALLAATLLIAPHAADLQALAAPALPEPREVPQPTRLPQITPAQEGPKYTLNGRRSVLVAGGEYADVPGRAGPGSAPRAWLCPDEALLHGPECAAGRLPGTNMPSAANTPVSGPLDRGPPA